MALALIATLMLLSSSPGGAASYAGPSTFADGSRERLVPASTCGSPDNQSGFLLPFDAIVTSLDFDLEVSANSSSTTGWFVAEVPGQGGALNLSVDNRTHGTLAGTPFNSYLSTVNASSGNVAVPILFTSCPTAGPWFLRVHNLSFTLSDTTAPIITVFTPSDGFMTQGTTIRLSARADDAGSGFAYNPSLPQLSAPHIEVSTDNAGWVRPQITSGSLTTLSFTYDFTGLAESDSALYVRAHDLAGNYRTRTIPIRVDRTAPIVTVLEPTVSSLVTNANTVRLAAETEVGAIVWVNGLTPPEILTRPDGAHVYFEMDIPVSEGPNTITVVAIDALDNQGSASVFILVDRQPPFLRVVEPAADALVNRTSVVVAGATEPTGVTLTVNGVDTPVDAQGNFSAYVVLYADLNRIEVVATDLAGNAQVVVREVTVDTVPPYVAVVAPANGAFLNTPEVNVFGVVEPGARLFVNGLSVDAPSGAFAQRVTLAEGLNTVALAAVDAAGNWGYRTLFLTLDTVAPRLQLLLPLAPVVVTNLTTLEVAGYTDSADATVRVSYPDPAGNPTAELRTVSQGSTPGRYDFAFVLDVQADGLPHSVLVVVTDLAGNSASGGVVYTSRAGPPPLAASASVPASGETSVWINGTTGEDVATVYVKGAAYDVVAGTFSVRLDLPPTSGAHEIIVRVVDARGGVAIVTLRADLAMTPNPLSIRVEQEGISNPTAGAPLTLTVSSAELLPLDAVVSWWIDGGFGGNGRSLPSVVLGPGDHTVRVEIHNATWSAGHSQQIHLSPASSAPLLPSAGLPVGLLLALVALGVAGAGLGGTEAGRFFVLFAALAAVTTRRKPASPLDHFVRGRLYEAISANPGIHYSELRRRAGLSNGSAAHHLRVLHRAGLVRVGIDGTRTRFYPTDRPLDDQSYGLSAADRQVLSTVAELPGLSEGELSGRLHVSLSTVSRSVDRLGALGHVITEQEGRRVRVFPRAGGEVEVQTAGPWPDEHE